MLKKLDYLWSKSSTKPRRKWPALIFLTLVVIALILFALFAVIPQKIDGLGMLLTQGELAQVVSPTAGTVESWVVEEGDSVKSSDPVALIRPYEDQTETVKVKTYVDGIIAQIIAYANTTVTKGQPLAIITKTGDPRKDLELIGFVSSFEGKKIAVGMKALVDPSVTNPYVHGHLLATVKRVGKLPMTKAAIQSVLKIPEVAKYIRSKIEGEPFVVVLSLVRDEKNKTGYRFSGRGPSFELDSGIFATFSIIYDEPSILNVLWPSIFPWQRAG